MEKPIWDISSSKELSLYPWVPGKGEGDGIPPDEVPDVFSAPLQSGVQTRIRPHVTFQAEDAVTQGIHDVVEGGLVGDVEEVFLVRVAGDVLDLANEILGVLLPAEVVPQHLGRGDPASPGGQIRTPTELAWASPTAAWHEGGMGKLRHGASSRLAGREAAVALTAMA